MLPEKFILVSVFLYLWSTAAYVRATLRGEIQPNRVTWFMWALAPLIAAAAQIAGGVGLSTLIVLMAGVCPLIIFACSFVNKKAYWKTTRFDYICGALALIGLAGWAISGNGDVAILFSILSDFCAAVPTYRKAYIDPQSENGLTYILAFLSTVIALLCVHEHNFTAYAFTAYLVVLTFSFCVTIYGKMLFSKFRAGVKI